MTLHCDAMIAATPLPLRGDRSYAAAALRSVKRKQSPALPDPLPTIHMREDEGQSAHPVAADQMVAAAAAAAAITPIATASPASPMASSCRPAAPCPSPLAAATASEPARCSAAMADCPASAEWTAEADDAEMSAEGLAIDQCDFEWPGDEADDIDEADDSDWSDDWSAEWSSDWSRMERLADSLHSAPAAGHSRKSRRAPPHSRTSAAALRAATSHSGALSAVCAKAAASAASVSEDDADQCPARQAKVSTGRLPSPFSSDDVLEQQRKLRAARERQLQDLRQSCAAVAGSSPSDEMSSAPSPPPSPAAAPIQRKGKLRAAVAAARKLPLHLHRCDNPRWAAVLQARAATKQHTAELKAHGPRPAVHISNQRQLCAPKSAHTRKAARVEAAAETRKQRRDQQEAKRKMQLQLQQQARDLTADAYSQPITATLVVAIAVSRWDAANPPPVAVTPPQRMKRSKVRRSAPAPLGLRMRPTVSTVTTALNRAVKHLGGDGSFAAFRRSWYNAHRSQLESALNGGVLSLRLATPSLSVQSTFVQRMAELGDSAPQLTFHGTAASNMPSILAHGFLRPGSAAASERNVRVVNGAAYGQGVYSSTTAEYSVGFCRGHSTMFVCAVLRGSDRAVSVHHNIVVTFDATRIVPLFYLDFKGNGTSNAPPQPSGRTRLDKQARAIQRKMAERALVAPPPWLLHALLRALHSRRAHAGRQLKLQTQMQSHSVSDDL